MRRLWLLLVCGAVLSAAPPHFIETRFGWVGLDVHYSAAHFSKTSLDLYLPHEDNFPVVLFVHGGSFVAGDRKEFPYAEIGEAFQKRGIACAVMSYRLSSDSGWPAQPRDVAAAFAWVKNNVEFLGGDPSKIYVVGHSAGGHLAALVCTDGSYLNAEHLQLNDVAGCVAMGAMMDDGGSLQSLPESEQRELFHTDWFFKIFGNKEQFENSFPSRHLHAGVPPFLLLVADPGDATKVRSVEAFVERARGLHVNARYEILPNRSHMGTVQAMTDPTDTAVDTIIHFINQPAPGED